MTTDPSPEERTRLRDPLVAFLVPTILLCGLSAALATWSVGQTFGGDGPDGYVDFAGRPSSLPPLVVDVDGHPALWVIVVIIGAVIGTAAWVSRTSGSRARRRALIGWAATILFVAAVIAVFTGVQLAMIRQAFDHGSTRPPIFGNATVTSAREIEAG